MMDLQWNFCGRYGDEHVNLSMPTPPEELSMAHQQALRQCYESRAGSDVVRTKERRWLEDNNYIREVGNAWNHHFMFAPQVLVWLHKPDKNEKLKANLQSQYT